MRITTLFHTEFRRILKKQLCYENAMSEIAIAYSPCHISAIAVLYRDSSIGAGLAIEEGMTTKIEVSHSPKLTSAFFMNNKSLENPVTSTEVVKKFRELYGKNFSLKVHHYCNLPIGYGLGTSGAGALSLSYALNHALNLNLPEKDVVQIAHDAEIVSRTGLSTVHGESNAGFVIRPKHKFRDAVVRHIRDEIYILPIAPLSTKQIIGTELWKSKINMIARKAMKEFMERQTLEALIRANRTIAFSTGLAELNSLFFRYLASNPHAGMAMFGFTLFSNRPISHIKVIKTRIASKKACLL